jgi:ABC-type multidrug transport system fused ATPase/permease subunit
LILVLTILKIFEIVVGIILPIFMALFTDSLLCRRTIADRFQTYSQNLPAPITQAAFETMLADLAFCQAQVPPVLGNNCCTGQKEDGEQSPFRLLVPLLAPNLRNNLEGFGRIEDLILVQVYFSLVATATRLMLDIGNTYFTNRFAGGLQRKVLDAFLAQDLGFFDARPTGVLLSRIMNDSADVQGVAVIFSMIVRIIAQIAFSATIAYGLNPSLFVLFICLIPFEFVIMYREGVFSRHWLLISNTRMGKHYQVMQEILDKIKHIKVFNGINAALEQYSNSLQLNYRIAAYVNYVTTFGFTLMLTLYQNVFQKSLDYISARLILQLNTVPNSNVPNSDVWLFTTNGRQFSFGDYGQFITYATTLKDSIKEAYSLRQAVNSTLVVTQTMVYFIFRKPVGGSEKTQGPGFVSRIQDVDPTIRFDNVSFAYPSRPGVGVLKKFSVTFPAKKFSCIIGNSGGGKSTTMSLILRMYEPSQGKIWLGKHEYNTVNLTFLRECFAYVTQEPVMFSCTIRENLLYANPLASSEQIDHALEEAGCKSIITSLPDGLETKLAGNVHECIAHMRLLADVSLCELEISGFDVLYDIAPCFCKRFLMLRFF